MPLQGTSQNSAARHWIWQTITPKNLNQNPHLATQRNWDKSHTNDFIAPWVNSAWKNSKTTHKAESCRAWRKLSKKRHSSSNKHKYALESSWNPLQPLSYFPSSNPTLNPWKQVRSATVQNFCQNKAAIFELLYLLNHKAKKYQIGLRGKISESPTKTSTGTKVNSDCKLVKTMDEQKLPNLSITDANLVFYV